MTRPAPTDTKPPTRLAQALASGEFVVSVELTPPAGAEPEPLLESARLVAELGIDFVSITDGPLGRPAMDSVAASHLVQDSLGIEAIAHVTTRDRTVAALEADLLGAHALGVRNVLALTGDPPRGDAEAAWEVDAIGLIELVDQLPPPTSLCVGVAFNHAAPDIEREVERLAGKRAAGAAYAVTQPFFDLDALERARAHLGGVDIPVVAGVLPLRDTDHAAQLNRHVDGIDVPYEVRQALGESSDPVRTGIELARRFIAEAQHLVDGFCLMPSPSAVSSVAHLLGAIDPAVHTPATTTRNASHR